MADETKNRSALSVSPGVNQPAMVNSMAHQLIRERRRKKLKAGDYFTEIIKGNRAILSQAITLIESSLPAHQEIAKELITLCIPVSGKSLRIGITGVPGVGKSTFIESFGKIITSRGKKTAILAIDPTSERTKGSILGDKTRMELLSTDPNAFIRPSPSGGSLGGVARKTRESIILCEAAGFDTIIVETVGVGQSETAVHSMVDFFLLLMLAGAGDELQGIKRGIMEMADAIAINKADGSNIQKANQAKAEYKNALHLFPPTLSKWEPKVVTCSSLSGDGINGIYEMVLEYEQLTKSNGFFSNRRNDQALYWMYESINENLKDHFYQNSKIQNKLEVLSKEVLNDKKSSFAAASELLEVYFNWINSKSSK